MRRSIQRWRLPPPPLAFLRRRWQRRRQPWADPAAAGGSNGGGSLLRRLSSPSGGGGGGRGLIAWRRLRAAVVTAEVGSGGRRVDGGRWGREEVAAATVPSS
uniref:Uncharacterized protein n=1 Tax=Oryza glumipatula TaxID=40148 RepID=A0A0E0AEG9_9ORYZ